jgi:hypothetical protein
MSTNANGKRDRDAVLIAALARGASYTEAARVAGLSKPTVARRMAEPAFRANVIEAREETIERVRGMLVNGSVAALRSLLELANNAESESVRLAASSRVVELVLRRRPGFDTYSEQEVAATIRALVEPALARIPKEEQMSYLQEVRAVGARSDGVSAALSAGLAVAGAGQRAGVPLAA